MQILLAINDALSAAEWQRISPYGSFPHKTGVQHVTQAGCQAMVGVYNTLAQSKGAKWKGLPIYVGHPDFDPKTWPDQTRLGSVMALEARADGLYGKLTWNDKGRKNVEEGYHVYPSPAWAIEKGQPVRLFSIGLTNTPNIADSDPWTNASIPDSGILNPESFNQSTNQEIPAMNQESGIQNQELEAPPTPMKPIALALSLAEDATEEQILAAIATLVTRATTAEANAATTTTAATTAANAADLRNQQLSAALVDQLQARLILPPTERETTLTALNSADYASTLTSLLTRKPVLNSRPVELDLSGSRVNIATEGDRRTALNSAIKTHTDKGLSYDAAYAKVKQDKQYAELFAAMVPL